MPRKSFRSVLALALVIVGLMWVAPRISGQLFDIEILDSLPSQNSVSAR